METYIATVTAKPGSEAEVASFYSELEPQYTTAKGFHGRQILKALPGTMLAAVRKVRSAEELAGHAEAEGPKGTQFIIIEQWENVDDRIAFSQSLDSSRAAKLFPHLLPEHTHEFYTDITP
jgi:hypothetical protein